MRTIDFNDVLRGEVELTEQDISQIIAVIGYRCRHNTLVRLRSILTYGKGTIKQYGIFNRLIKENGHWCYVAGQSYTDELKTVRDCILRG